MFPVYISCSYTELFTRDENYLKQGNFQIYNLICNVMIAKTTSVNNINYTIDKNDP